MENQDPFETILRMHPKQAAFLNTAGTPILHMTGKKLCTVPSSQDRLWETTVSSAILVLVDEYHVLVILNNSLGRLLISSP